MQDSSNRIQFTTPAGSVNYVVISIVNGKYSLIDEATGETATISGLGTAAFMDITIATTDPLGSPTDGEIWIKRSA
jgi:hypothetical protein